MLDEEGKSPPEGDEDTEAPENEQVKENLELPVHDDGAQANPPGFDANSNEKSLEALYQVPVQVSAVLGKTTMQVNQLLKLGRGAVVELDRRVGDAIDIFVNDRLVAKGEIIVVDEHLGVTLTEIIKSEQAA